jgi:hypothetical protein
VAVREGRFLRPCDAPLAAGTVKSTLNNVAAAFWSQGHPNPTRDKAEILDWNLARQYQACKSMDSKEVQEKAIPLKVISLMECVRETEIQQATGQLIIGAFFYAC